MVCISGFRISANAFAVLSYNQLCVIRRCKHVFFDTCFPIKLEIERKQELHSKWFKLLNLQHDVEDLNYKRTSSKVRLCGTKLASCMARGHLTARGL
jgi:hypothetical protein